MLVSVVVFVAVAIILYLVFKGMAEDGGDLY